jgi:hypothetical protein
MTPQNYNELSSKERRILREEYVRHQGGNCYYCNAPLNGPPAMKAAKVKITPSLYPAGFFRWPVHLHHDHDTGMTIGAVHNRCNAILWEYHNE